MPTAATVERGSAAFLAWCSLFSWCFGYSAALAASAEFRLISRPGSSLRWRGDVPAPSLNQRLGGRSVDTDPFALPEIVGRAP